jgi:hypothetical protein
MTAASKHISAIERRKNHLEKRTADRPDLSFDLSELSALRWVLETLNNPQKREKGHAMKVEIINHGDPYGDWQKREEVIQTIEVKETLPAPEWKQSIRITYGDTVIEVTVLNDKLLLLPHSGQAITTESGSGKGLYVGVAY